MNAKQLYATAWTLVVLIVMVIITMVYVNLGVQVFHSIILAGFSIVAGVFVIGFIWCAFAGELR